MAQLKRGCTPALLTELSGHFHPVILTEAEWVASTEYFHSGFGQISWNGQTWEGLGKYTNWSIPQEATGLVNAEATVSIAATIENIFATRGDKVRNLSITAYFGVTTTAGGAVLAAEPVILFTGTYDSRTRQFRRNDDNLSHDMVMGVTIGPSARSSASLTHGPEDQSTKFPGDTAGDKVVLSAKNRVNPQKWPE